MSHYRKGAGKPRASRSQPKSKRKAEQEDPEEVKRDSVMKSLKGNSGQVIQIVHLVVTDDSTTKIKASVQNRKKNIAGLIANRVKRCCLQCIKGKKKDLVNANRKYIYTIFAERKISDRTSDFVKFLKGFKSTWKTWEIQLDYFVKNVYYAQIFLECIIQFLGPEGDEDFNEWLDNSKRLGLKNRSLIIDDKKEFQEKFILILKEVQRHQ